MDHFNTIFKKLCDKLKNECVLEETSQHFASFKSNYERFKFSLTLLEDSELLPSLEFTCSKSCMKSVKLRNEGNHLFLKKKDMDALECYSKSVACAPIDSEELSLAFANRSAVSFSLKRFEDCITDIDRALSGKYPENLLFKLYERKGNCLKKLGKKKCAEENFESAINLICKSKLSDEKKNHFRNALKEELNNLVSDSVNVCGDSSSSKSDEKLIEPVLMPRLSYQQNDEIVSGCDAIKIDYNEEMGRHIVATKTVNPGDVLVVEQPYASVLLPSSYYLYCFNCLKRSHTLLPCRNCCKVLFCCDECRDNSYKNSHQIECKILPSLIDLGCNKLELLAVRTLMVASKCDKLKSLSDYVNAIEKQNDSLIDRRLIGFDENGLYKSDDYRTAHLLATNTDLRTNADLFRRACFAGCIVNCIDKLSNYFFMNTVGDSDSNSLAITSDNYGDYFDNKCFAGSLILRYLQIMPCNAHEVSEMCVTKYSNRKQLRCIGSGDEITKDDLDDRSLVYDSREIGGALYPVLSLINHSCDPNVVRHSHNGDAVVLTALQRIYQGEQILDNYGYHHAVHDLNARQSHLLSQYYFTCNCIACREDWPQYHLLPDKQPIYKMPELRLQVEKSSQEFRVILEQVLKGNFTETDVNVLDKLTRHLSLLEDAISRPWKEYSECQEAIKQTLSMYANHYVLVL